jgi:hypothetical protein
MVADNKQQSASDKETLSTVTVGGEQSRPARTFHMPKISKKNLLYALLVVIVLAGGWLVLRSVFHIGEKVYAQAAGHKIYKENIDSLIGSTKGISNHDAATVLANQYLYQAMAKEAGIVVIDKDVAAQYPDINYQKAHNKYAYQSNVNTVYFNKLAAYNSGLYQGKLLVANFSRHIAFQSPFLDIQEATDPLLGNPAAVAADKQYAHDFITKLYNQVKTHQITFDQAIQMEHNDPQVGLKAYQTLSHSGPFNTSNVYLGATGLIMPKSIQSKINNMKAGQLSAPFVVRVSNSLRDKNVTTDSYYLVVQMDSTKSSHSGLTVNQYFAQAKKRLGYMIYV